MYNTDKEKILALLAFLNISKFEFSKETSIPSATIYDIVNHNDGKELSKANLRNIAKRYIEISPGWLLTGEGEMLKKPPDEKKYTAEIGPNETFFSRNLAALLSDQGQTPEIIASLIPYSLETITSLLEGHVGPSLRLLIRLRDLWGVGIDDMLFTDLSLPENMKLVKDQNALEARVAALERALKVIEEKERKKERTRRRSEPKEPST